MTKPAHSLRRTFLTLSVSIVLASWLGGTAAVWLHARYHRGISGVQYADILLPMRWSNYRQALGDHYINEALSLLASRDAAEAVFKLRVGVAKSPSNKLGRRLLAQIYAANHRPDLAREVWVAGLEHLPRDTFYLGEVFRFLFDQQRDTEVAAICARLLPATAGPDDRNHLLALAAATAAFNRGHYDRAEILIETHRLHQSTAGTLLQARIDWERGYRELAVLRLENLRNQTAAPDAVLVQLAQYYRALRRLDALERNAILRLARAPLSAAPRIDLLYVYHERGDHPRLQRETDHLFAHFAHDASALIQLANFAANTGRPELAQRVHALCLARGHKAEGPALMVLEAHLVAGQYQTALDRLAAAAQAHPDWPERFVIFFHSLQAVALRALDKTAEARPHLDHFLAQQNLRAEHLVAVSQRLLAIHAAPEARAVLTRAAEADPFNQAALTQLVKIELETNATDALPAHLHQLLKTRKPARQILQAAYDKLGSDFFLFNPEQPALLAALHAALASAPDTSL